MHTNDSVGFDLDALYSVDPKQEWLRGDGELKQGITLLAEAFQALNTLDTEIPVRATYAPKKLAELIDLSLPTQPHSLATVINRLYEVTKLAPSTSSRAFFNQLFAGRDPAALFGELFAAFGNHSVYTYKVAAPIVLIEDALIQRLGQISGLVQGPKRCGGIFTPGGSLSNLAAMLCARDKAQPSWRRKICAAP